MGSRLRQDVKHFFECFCEVSPQSKDLPAWIIQKFPESYKDENVLKSVPKFASPCEFDKSVTQHYSFVLTNADSKWAFGFCKYDTISGTIFVILTYLPWHEAFTKFLNYISDLIHGSNSNCLWKFLDAVYESKVPRAGYDLTVSVSPSTNAYTCEVPSQFKLPSIPENRNLTEYYNAIDTYNMMIIFASMLFERRIIFVSKKLSRLSACVQSANALLYPMSWQHIFIPVLPQSLLDYLLAPMPYLIGLPFSLLNNIKRNDIGDIVLMNCDTNEIETPFSDLESIPSDVVNNLQKQLRNRAMLLGDGVSRAFLRAVVQLIGGYRDALKIDQGRKITFCEKAFVETRPPPMRSFLMKMLELQIFQQFIEERLELLNAGLGFSDEFELEVCNYLDKSNSKIQQYKEWVYSMKKEGSAFFKTVKNRANPAMKSAVKTVKDKGRDVRSAYKGIRSKLKERKDDKSASAPNSPSTSRSELSVFDMKNSAATSIGNVTKGSPQFHVLRNSPASSPQSDEDISPLKIDLMGDLQDVIFQNCYTVPDINDNTKTSLNDTVEKKQMNEEHKIIDIADSLSSSDPFEIVPKSVTSNGPTRGDKRDRPSTINGYSSDPFKLAGKPSENKKSLTSAKSETAATDNNVNNLKDLIELEERILAESPEPDPLYDPECEYIPLMYGKIRLPDPFTDLNTPDTSPECCELPPPLPTSPPPSVSRKSPPGEKSTPNHHTTGLMNPLYPYYDYRSTAQQKDAPSDYLLSEYGIDFNKFKLCSVTNNATTTRHNPSEWTKFE